MDKALIILSMVMLLGFGFVSGALFGRSIGRRCTRGTESGAPCSDKDRPKSDLLEEFDRTGSLYFDAPKPENDAEEME